MTIPRFSLIALTTLFPAASSAVLVTTWTADNATLGDAGAASVLLEASPVASDMTSSVGGAVTDYTDVFTLNATQQMQLSSVGLPVTQGLDNVRGDTRKLIGSSFEGFGTQGGSGNVTTRDATIDLFFSPDSLSDASQMIFETGGSGAGSSVHMNGTTMTFAAAQNAGTAVNTSIDLSTIYDVVPDTEDMLLVRLAINMAGDEIVLSATNLGTGLSTNSSVAFTGADWAGGDGTGIFNTQGSTGGSAGGNVPASYSNFDGQFGGMKFYTDEVLSPIPEPSSSVMVFLALSWLGARRVRK
ncbi:MAG: PEP-CTERM sorting domain-containing protein [Verrucomicrobiaceae bacterium]